MYKSYYLASFVSILWIACTLFPRPTEEQNLAVHSETEVESVARFPDGSEPFKLTSTDSDRIWFCEKHRIWVSLNGGKDWSVLYDDRRAGEDEIEDFEQVDDDRVILKRGNSLVLVSSLESDRKPIDLPNDGFIYRGMLVDRASHQIWVFGERWGQTKLDFPDIQSNLFSSDGRTSFGVVYSVEGNRLQLAFNTSNPDRIVSGTNHGGEICFGGVNDLYCVDRSTSKWKSLHVPVPEQVRDDSEIVSVTSLSDALLISLKNGAVIDVLPKEKRTKVLFVPPKNFFARSQNEFFLQLFALAGGLVYGLSSDGQLYVSNDQGSRWQGPLGYENIIGATSVNGRYLLVYSTKEIYRVQ